LWLVDAAAVATLSSSEEGIRFSLEESSGAGVVLLTESSGVGASISGDGSLLEINLAGRLEEKFVLADLARTEADSKRVNLDGLSLTEFLLSESSLA